MLNNPHENKKLTKKLKGWTKVDQNIQRETWEKIDQQLFQKDKQKKVLRRNWLMAISAAAIILVAMFGFLTETGQAVVKEIKDLFVTEKQQDIEIEGDKETTDVELHANELLDYVIYIDKDSYKMEQLDDIDRIITQEPLGENYPEVYMEISQEIGKTKEEMIDEIKTLLINDGLPIIHEETISEPIEALEITGYEQDDSTGDMHNDWDSIIHKYLIVEVSTEQLFIIKQAYFLEASEGHGA